MDRGAGGARRPGSVVGVGIDLADIERLRSALDRQSGLRTRLFTEVEWSEANQHRDPVSHLAGCFAAKESVMKALGQGMSSMGFDEIQVAAGDHGRPGIELTGRAARVAAEQGVGGWLLSMSLTDSMAQAVAIAVSGGPPVSDATLVE